MREENNKAAREGEVRAYHNEVNGRQEVRASRNRGNDKVEELQFR
jgi:hypothetical protein